MYGTFWTRSASVVRHMIFSPRHAVRWVVNRVSRKTPLDLRLPWITYPAIDFLRSHLRPGMRVLEWGAGGSTVFFALAGCQVTSVETDRHWFELVSARLRSDSLASAVNLRYVDLLDGDGALAVYLAFVRDAAWDAVLVDGPLTPDRMSCVAVAGSRVKAGGLIVLDDAWLSEYASAESLLPGYDRLEFWGLGPARLGVSKTDIYVRRR